MSVLLTVLIFLLAIGFLLRGVLNYMNFRISLNETNAFIFLMAWIIWGFLTRLDYSEALGCIIGYEPIHDPKNILFSTLSLSLILWAFKTKNVTTKKIICIVEFLFWVGKLIIYKGGYAIGFGGTPSLSIVFYDLVSISARIFIISELFKFTRYQFIKIGGISLFVLSIKILIFAMPLRMILEDQKLFEEAQEIRVELIGDWNGEVTISEDDQLKSEQKIHIRIDANKIYLDSIDGLERKYQLILDYPNYGMISKTGEFHSYRLSIKKRTKDSLIMTFDDFFKKYKFELKKE